MRAPPHLWVSALATVVVALILAGAPSVLGAAEPINAPPTPADWAALAKLPDWSGIWAPDTIDQVKREKTDEPPWTPKVAEQIAFMRSEEKAGRPRLIFFGCLPESMPAWMLISHNAMEILFTPGRVTMLGESDGNRLRRIYTDGRKHPDDPVETFHGHSVGHWEGDTLVVDTVGVMPQTPIAISEAVGIPNNGDMHVVERIHLGQPDILNVDLEIAAPHVLTKPWKTTRIYHRIRQQKFDIVEGTCLEGQFSPEIDKDGNHIFKPVPYDPNGNVLPPSQPSPTKPK